MNLPLKNIANYHLKKTVISFVFSVVTAVMVLLIHWFADPGPLTSTGIGIGLILTIMQAIMCGFSSAAHVVTDHVERLRK